MNSESKAKFEKLRMDLYKIQDALMRATDGCTSTNWDCLTLGYVQNQLLRVNRFAVDAIEKINNEVNGRREGEPPGAREELPD